MKNFLKDKKIVPILSILFGILILLKPDLLAIVVAVYLIFYGVSELV